MSTTTFQPLTSLTFDTKVPVTNRIVDLDVVTPADRIPPFQILRPTNIHGLTDITVEAIYPNAGTVIDIKALLDAADPMQLFTMNDGTDRIIWVQSLPLTAYLDGGRFYVKVSDTVTTWYSRYMLQVRCGDIVVYPPSADIDIDETEIPIL